MGIHKQPRFFIRMLRANRRNALINIYTSISWNTEDNAIRINTYNGRVTRPILIAEKKDQFQTEINRLRAKQANWYDMIQGKNTLDKLSNIAKQNMFYFIYLLFF